MWRYAVAFAAALTVVNGQVNFDALNCDFNARNNTCLYFLAVRPRTTAVNSNGLVVSIQQPLRLVSPLFSLQQPICVSLVYVYYGSVDTAPVIRVTVRGAQRQQIHNHDLTATPGTLWYSQFVIHNSQPSTASYELELEAFQSSVEELTIKNVRARAQPCDTVSAAYNLTVHGEPGVLKELNCDFTKSSCRYVYDGVVTQQAPIGLDTRLTAQRATATITSVPVKIQSPTCFKIIYRYTGREEASPMIKLALSGANTRDRRSWQYSADLFTWWYVQLTLPQTQDVVNLQIESNFPDVSQLTIRQIKVDDQACDVRSLAYYDEIELERENERAGRTTTTTTAPTAPNAPLSIPRLTCNFNNGHPCQFQADKLRHTYETVGSNERNLRVTGGVLTSPPFKLGRRVCVTITYENSQPVGGMIVQLVNQDNGQIKTVAHRYSEQPQLRSLRFTIDDVMQPLRLLVHFNSGQEGNSQWYIMLHEITTQDRVC